METLQDCRDQVAALTQESAADPSETASQLFALAVWIRGRAWRDRQGAMTVVKEIDAAISEICREHGLTQPPQWTLSDVIAGGPGWSTRWPGYSR